MTADQFAQAAVPGLIAGIVGVVGLVVAKESKISEFRQAWIDALRAEIAVLLANISAAVHAMEDNSADIRDGEARAALMRANEALFAIRLRLNGSEKFSGAVLETLQDIENLSNGDWKSKLGKVLALEKDSLRNGNILLKDEWTRVKQGEKTYRWSIYLLVTSSVVLALSLAIWH